MNEKKTLEESGARCDLSLLSEQKRGVLKRRLAYVEAVERRSGVSLKRESIEPIVESLAETLEEDPPGWYSVYRWLKRYRGSRRDPLSLIPYALRYSKRAPRLSKEVDSIVNESISEIYLNRRKCSAREVWKEIKSRILDYNQQNLGISLVCPSYKTICNRISNLSEYEKTIAREGYGVARAKFRQSFGGVRTERLLQRVEIDHTLLDLYVLEDETGELAGRPTLTTALDSRSRTLVGLYVGFEPPSYLCVAECLKCAILPKSWIKESYPMVKHDWICSGIPECIVVDNGKEFHSSHLSDACISLGIKLEHTAPRSPWLKGQVERYFRTLNQGIVHKQLGSTLGQKNYPPNFDPQNDACVGFSDFMAMLYVWVIDIYHQQIHRTLQNTPHKEWQRLSGFSLPLLSRTPRDICIALCRAERRVLSHKGIEFNGLFYNSRELANMYRRSDKQKVYFKIDPTDISWIAVYDPIGQLYFDVPALRIEYAQGKTLWQHRVINRFRRETNKQLGAEIELTEAEQKIKSMINEASSKKRNKARYTQKQSRFKNIGNMNVASEGFKEESFDLQEEKDNIEYFYGNREGWSGGYLEE